MDSFQDNLEVPGEFEWPQKETLDCPSPRNLLIHEISSIASPQPVIQEVVKYHLPPDSPITLSGNECVSGCSWDLFSWHGGTYLLYDMSLKVELLGPTLSASNKKGVQQFQHDMWSYCMCEWAAVAVHRYWVWSYVSPTISSGCTLQVAVQKSVPPHFFVSCLHPRNMVAG